MKVRISRYGARFRAGFLDVTIGDYAVKKGPFWLWNGIHIWIFDYYFRWFWFKGAPGIKAIEYGKYECR